MRKWIARSVVGLTVLVSGAGAAFMVLAEMGDRKLTRQVDVAVEPVAFRSDAASVERGGYLFRSRGCGDCHGANGAGSVVVDDGGMYIRSPDITPAANGVVAAYAPVDWVRTIRHGVKPDGRPVMIMPSEEYNRFVDADLAAIVAYVRQLPAASGARAEVRLPMPVKALYAAGVVKDASEKIDHSLAPAQPVPEGVTAAHGAYVANSCIGCHGARLAGGKIPGAPPDWPPAAKLTPGAGSALDRYATPEAFMAMLKSGRRPDGSSVSKVMPFVSLKELNDVDARALYLHLRSLPAGS
ncbi:MAG TPA: c-type cytochrome [Caldimonas sp.]|jgi:mono/diheme cytochrome c family protein|nr:c-type cytochrome [Caldimonas sp.]HEV7576908.1 c-type cytochrome [Caldimonas sp.]